MQENMGPESSVTALDQTLPALEETQPSVAMDQQILDNPVSFLECCSGIGYSA